MLAAYGALFFRAAPRTGRGTAGRTGIESEAAALAKGRFHRPDVRLTARGQP